MHAAHSDVEKDLATRKLLLENPANRAALSALIDHTLLKSEAQESQIQSLINEAMLYRFRSVCVSGSYTETARKLLNAKTNNYKPIICTVIGFPLGHSSTSAKSHEVCDANEIGAEEFDFVQNMGWVKDGYWEKLTTESMRIVEAAQGKLVKVILETSLLTDEEIYNSALAAARGGVHVLKTSTGFGHRGASHNDIRILNAVVNAYEKISNTRLGIKASGGIKSTADALTLIQMGATRLGTSSGIILVNGLEIKSSDTY